MKSMQSLRSALAPALAPALAMVALLGATAGIGVTPAGAQVINSPNPVVTGNELVQFGYRIPLNHRFETYNINTQQYTPVDAMSVPQRIAGGAYVYDRTAGAWVTHPTLPNGRNDTYLATAQSSAPSPSANQKDWQRIHGTAQSISGTTLTLKADDGRLITVDMAPVSQNVRAAITQGERIEVAGHYTTDQTHMTAQYIQQDSDQRAWQKVHGTVRVLGQKLQIRADDGRWIAVDTSAVSPNVVNALTINERVTITGHYTIDDKHMNARFIQQEGAAGAASPRSK